jgi:hypothetical protein
MYRMNLAELPALRILEEHAEALRAEALALPEALFVPMPSRERYTGAWRAVLLDVGPWGAEFPGVDIPHNRSLCPVATALLARLPVASVAGYLRLDPGATLATHTEGPVERNGQKWARQRGAFPANRDLEPQEGAWWREVAILSLKKTIFREKSRS